MIKQVATAAGINENDENAIDVSKVQDLAPQVLQKSHSFLDTASKSPFKEKFISQVKKAQDL